MSDDERENYEPLDLHATCRRIFRKQHDENERLLKELANRTQAARWLYQWVESSEWTHFDDKDSVILSHWPWLKEVTDE